MGVMNNMTLPLPNPSDWCTITAAARRLGVHERTVRRMVESGVLTGYLPTHTHIETPQVMLWISQVEEVAAARQRIGKPGA